MAISLKNPDLHEGREIVIWRVVPDRATTPPPPPGQKRITSPVLGKGIVVPGGIDYDRGTVTIRTESGELLTAPADEADFTDLPHSA